MCGRTAFPARICIALTATALCVGVSVKVHFDGMGPTWSVLVKKGLEHYPNITHGDVLLRDALI
jgi:hypothetical protein